MKNAKRFGGVFLLLTALSGCIGRPVRLDSPPLGPVDVQRGRTISAGACGFQLLLLIPIGVNTRQARAHQSLREQAGGDWITDVRVQERWFYGFVGTGYCTDMEATAYPRLVKEIQ